MLSRYSFIFVFFSAIVSIAWYGDQLGGASPLKDLPHFTGAQAAVELPHRTVAVSENDRKDLLVLEAGELQAGRPADPLLIEVAESLDTNPIPIESVVRVHSETEKRELVAASGVVQHVAASGVVQHVAASGVKIPPPSYRKSKPVLRVGRLIIESLE